MRKLVEVRYKKGDTQVVITKDDTQVIRLTRDCVFLILGEDELKMIKRALQLAGSEL